MNESHDELTDRDEIHALEQELQSLRPRGLSSDVVDEIGQTLAATRPTHRWPKWMPLTVAVAASLLLLISWVAWRAGETKNEELAKEKTTPPVAKSAREDQPQELLLVGPDDSPPTLLAYGRAAEKSFNELDHLLAQHGGGSMGGPTPVVLGEFQ